MMVSLCGVAAADPDVCFHLRLDPWIIYEEVIAYYARPFPAIVAALTMLVGFFHFQWWCPNTDRGLRAWFRPKVAIIGMICLSYGAAALAIFAIVRLAL